MTLGTAAGTWSKFLTRSYHCVGQRSSILHNSRNWILPNANGAKLQSLNSAKLQVRTFGLHTSLDDQDAIPAHVHYQSPGDKNVAGGDGFYRRIGGIGYPMMFTVTTEHTYWDPIYEEDGEVVPRDEFGVPGHIPPEVSTKVQHYYALPPIYYPFFKRLGEETPALKQYMDKLIAGKFSYTDYETMFYRFAKPLKIYRDQIPLPYRSEEEMARSPEVNWESAWYSFRSRVSADYYSQHNLRSYITGALVGVYFAWLFLDKHRQYRLDMKLFYLEAPEYKMNWVKPRGDLV